MAELVPAAHRWPTNAHLIEDVARLYLSRAMHTLDPTYGRGLWWTRWKPERLVTHDRYRGDGVDFRALPELDRTFDLVAFDPPYVCMGGRKTTGLPDFTDRFGLDEAPKSPAELQQHNDAGLEEVWRVLAFDGLALVKCKAYVSSGRLWPGDYFTLGKAYELGFQLVDRFDYLTKGAQPTGRTRKARRGEEADEAGKVPSQQAHARHRPSVLYVLRKPTPRRAGPPVPGQLTMIRGGAA